MADTLATLARLRRLQATAARRDVADALRAEAEAEAALHQARQAPLDEAGRVNASQDQAVAAAFARWLPRAAAQIRGQAARLDTAGRTLDAARQTLQAAEGALEAVETLREEREALARRTMLRRAQMLLDEAGLRAGR